MVIGHEVGSCTSAGSPIDNFTIVDTTGIHTIPVSFCQCIGTPHSRIQLLQSGLMPASTNRPRSAFTFDVLNTFHLITLQGKVSAFDYYYSLEHKSDNTGLSKPKVFVSFRYW